MKTSDSSRPGKSWTRHLFYRTETVRTTWKLRLSILLLLTILIPATQGIWAPRMAQSLVCKEQISPSDAFIVENFDPNYLVFEHTTTLQRTGVATKAFVPMMGAIGTDTPNSIEQGSVDLMVKVSWLQSIEFIPIRVEEPISLNAARQIRDVLVSKHIRSIIVVSPGFRSRRSFLVYDAVLTPAGITVRCSPVFGTKSPANWTETWHGIQDVVEQFVKLQYYRFWVLPYKQ